MWFHHVESSMISLRAGFLRTGLGIPWSEIDDFPSIVNLHLVQWCSHMRFPYRKLLHSQPPLVRRCSQIFPGWYSHFTVLFISHIFACYIALSLVIYIYNIYIYTYIYIHIPSGYLTVRHGKSQFLIGKPSRNGPSIPFFHGYVRDNEYRVY